MRSGPRDLVEDAEDAVRILSGLLRRGEAGEAFRELRQVVTWRASEAGLLSPSVTAERGTAIRIRRGGQLLLVARSGTGPDALRDAAREASRRTGGSPFLKRRGGSRAPEEGAPSSPGLADRTAALASALARALPDPRGLSVSLVVSQVGVSRAVITPHAAHVCGIAPRLQASGVVRRSDGRRPFAFQSCAPFDLAVEAFARSVQEAVRPGAPVPPPNGEADVILSPSAAAIFWHEAVGHPLEAEPGEKGSMLSRVARAAVASPGLELTDDPFRADLPGGYLFDDEGTPARPVRLIEDGRVVGLLSDKRTAGASSNGHGRCADWRRPPRPRLSNLVVSPGRATHEELLALCGTGLFVREISAGTADPESGRFALFVERADSIRRGRAAGPVGRFALTGDILGALRRLEGERGDSAPGAPGLGLCVKGGDPLPVGGASPSILIHGLLVRRVVP